MKLLSLCLALFFTITLFGEDCDKPENKKKGCVTEVSQNLIDCLIKAETKDQIEKCHLDAKKEKCKAVEKKFPKEEKILDNCINKFSDKKIDCLLKDGADMKKCD